MFSPGAKKLRRLRKLSFGDAITRCWADQQQRREAYIVSAKRKLAKAAKLLRARGEHL